MNAFTPKENDLFFSCMITLVCEKKQKIILLDV